MKESELKKTLAQYLKTESGDKNLNLTPDTSLTAKPFLSAPSTQENLTMEASDLLTFFEILITIDKESKNDDSKSK